jgi:lysine N6-hydroxylase
MDTYKLIGIGIGPANLSLAAMLEGSGLVAAASERLLFLERKREFTWHEGQLFPGARMQNSFARDLVTLADPTNPFSFLAFLKRNGRLLQFLNAGFFMPSREEFVAYFQWVISNLSSLQFNCEVTSVDFDEAADCFTVGYATPEGARSARAENIVIGTGLVPKSPPFRGGQAPRGWIHVSEMIARRPVFKDKQVVVIGGGQSSAELVDYVLSAADPPSSLIWVTRDSNLAPLDTGNATREFYTPGYARHFYAQSDDRREQILKREGRAESGVSAWLLESLYQRIYHRRHVAAHRMDVRIIPNVDVIEVGESDSDSGCRLRCQSADDGQKFHITADIAVGCTGFGQPDLDILRPLERMGVRAAQPLDIGPDFSLAWNGSPERRIFVQSLSRQLHGLGDPNFTMVCHRNSIITNRVFDRILFPVDYSDMLIDWSGSAADGREYSKREDL